MVWDIQSSTTDCTVWQTTEKHWKLLNLSAANSFVLADDVSRPAVGLETSSAKEEPFTTERPISFQCYTDHSKSLKSRLYRKS
jgi:hypothetical protein